MYYRSGGIYQILWSTFGSITSIIIAITSTTVISGNNVNRNYIERANGIADHFSLCGVAFLYQTLICEKCLFILILRNQQRKQSYKSSKFSSCVVDPDKDFYSNYTVLILIMTVQSAKWTYCISPFILKRLMNALKANILFYN